MKILIIDDYEPVRLRLKRLLSTIPGIGEIATACDGVHAETMYREFAPDIIVLDLQMPGKSGLEFLSGLMSRNSEAIVLILTNHATPALREECIRHGAYQVFDKTMEFHRVIEVVEEFCRRAGS